LSAKEKQVLAFANREVLLERSGVELVAIEQ